MEWPFRTHRGRAVSVGVTSVDVTDPAASVTPVIHRAALSTYLLAYMVMRSAEQACGPTSGRCRQIGEVLSRNFQLIVTEVHETTETTRTRSDENWD